MDAKTLSGAALNWAVWVGLEHLAGRKDNPQDMPQDFDPVGDPEIAGEQLVEVHKISFSCSSRGWSASAPGRDTYKGDSFGEAVCRAFVNFSLGW